LGSFLIDLFISIFRLPASSNFSPKRTKLSENYDVVDLSDIKEEASIDCGEADRSAGTGTVMQPVIAQVPTKKPVSATTPPTLDELKENTKATKLPVVKEQIKAVVVVDP
jgi:hypothetical protein